MKRKKPNTLIEFRMTLIICWQEMSQSFDLKIYVRLPKINYL